MKRYLYWCCLAIATLVIGAWKWPKPAKEEKDMVMVEGFHYMPYRFQVMEFRVN